MLSQGIWLQIRSREEDRSVEFSRVTAVSLALRLFSCAAFAVVCRALVYMFSGKGDSRISNESMRVSVRGCDVGHAPLDFNRNICVVRSLICWNIILALEASVFHACKLQNRTPFPCETHGLPRHGMPLYW